MIVIATVGGPELPARVATTLVARAWAAVLAYARGPLRTASVLRVYRVRQQPLNRVR